MITPFNYAHQTEHSIQAAFFIALNRAVYTSLDEVLVESNWRNPIDVTKKVNPRLEWIYAIPNGEKRAIGTATKLKAEGVKRGIPDVFIPVPNSEYGGMYIEFKTVLGVLSSHQKEFINMFSDRYKIVVCRTWKDAIIELKKYLTIL